MRRDSEFHPSPIQMRHAQEVLQLLDAMTGEHQYDSILNNREKGVPDTMCEVLDRMMRSSREDGINMGRELGINMGREIGINMGKEIGIAEGEGQMARLMERLFAQDRTADAAKAAKDPEFRHKLYKELGI